MTHTLALVRVERLGWHWRILHVIQTIAVPAIARRAKRRRRGPDWRWVLVVRSPLDARRTVAQHARLVRLWVHVLRRRSRSIAMPSTIRGLTFQQRQSRLDVGVARVELSSSGVGIERIAGLILAGLVLRSVRMVVWNAGRRAPYQGS